MMIGAVFRPESRVDGKRVTRTFKVQTAKNTFEPGGRVARKLTQKRG